MLVSVSPPKRAIPSYRRVPSTASCASDSEDIENSPTARKENCPKNQIPSSQAEASGFCAAAAAPTQAPAASVPQDSLIKVEYKNLIASLAFFQEFYVKSGKRHYNADTAGIICSLYANYLASKVVEFATLSEGNFNPENLKKPIDLLYQSLAEAEKDKSLKIATQVFCTLLPRSLLLALKGKPLQAFTTLVLHVKKTQGAHVYEDFNSCEYMLRSNQQEIIGDKFEQMALTAMNLINNEGVLSLIEKLMGQFECSSAMGRYKQNYKFIKAPCPVFSQTSKSNSSCAAATSGALTPSKED